MEDNIKIREDPAARLDRKMKNNRTNLMKQKKKIQGQPYMTTGKTTALIIMDFCCLCFSTHCLSLSSLSCQEAIVF